MSVFGKAAAKETEHRILKMQDAISKGALAHSLRPSVVAAIISRETAALDMYCLPPPIGKLGDEGHGHGPMQVDNRSFPDWCVDWASGRTELTPEDGILKGCEVLASKVGNVQKLIPGLPVTQLLQAAIAAYNCGAGSVRAALAKGQNIDARTTGQNYSADVLERAAYFASIGMDK